MTPTDTTPPQASPPPPPPAQHVPVRRLTRRASDRVLGGVVGGVADFFGVDTLLARILWVVAVPMTGGGALFLYLALWVFVPEDATGDVIARREAGWVEDARRLRSERGFAFWAGIALIAFAGVSLLEGVFFFDGGVLWALVLMGVGIALFRSSPQGSGTTGVAHEATVAEAVAEAVNLTGSPAEKELLTTPPAPRPRHPRRPKEHSILGRLTLGVAMLWVGVAALLDEVSAAIDFTAVGVVGIALAIVGGGLVVGGFVGRARSLVFLGVLLLPVLFASAVYDRIDIPVSAGIGQPSYELTDASPTLDVELFAGEILIGMVGHDLATVDRVVHARMGLGVVVVDVPSNWRLIVDASVDAGSIRVEELDGNGLLLDEGFGATLGREWPGVAGAPTATLILDVAVGQINIHRSQPTAVALPMSGVRATIANEVHA